MNLLLSLNSDFSAWLWGYRSLLVSSWVAVVLVVYGGELNNAVRRILQPYHFVLRMTAFVLLCTFGYGMLTFYSELAINVGLLHFNRHWFGLIVVSVFLVLSFLA